MGPDSLRRRCLYCSIQRGPQTEILYFVEIFIFFETRVPPQTNNISPHLITKREGSTCFSLCFDVFYWLGLWRLYIQGAANL